MGKYLDLDDVAAGHPVALKELKKLRDSIDDLLRRDAPNDFGSTIWGMCSTIQIKGPR